MSYQKRIFLFFLLFSAISYCLPADYVHGARISGDSHVTPSAPEADSSDPESQPPSSEEGMDIPPDETNDPSLTGPDRGETTDVAEEEVSEPPVPEANRKVSVKNTVKSPADSKTDKKGEIYIDFKADTDLIEFIQYISELTGTNFLIDSSVKGKVTIISPSKITVEEAYKVFESVLEVNGYTTVPAGKITKIVPMTEARTKDIDTQVGRETTDPEDRIVTQLIPLKYADPDDIQKALSSFISKGSLMTTYSPTGMLIVTDVLSNINRILEVIEKLDVEGTSEIISVIPLEYAGAETMAKNLTSVFKTTATKSSKDASSTTIIIVADTRTNSLITSASEVDTLKIKELIKLLDKEAPKGEGGMHVYPLNNADAEELAKVLTSIPTGTSSTSSSGTGTESVKESAVVLSKDITIIADKATNSLVINAGKDDYLVLEDIIKKLDIVRKMVYIEALIMEVSMSKDFNLGVQWYGAKETGTVNGNDVYSFASSNTGTSLIDSSGNLDLPEGMSLGVLGDTITVGSLTFPSIQAFIQAYSTNSDVNILSTPQVTALDNEEATIKVVNNVPYLTSKQETTSGNDYSNYDYKDVGVTLKITPQINQERFVKLKVEQTVSQVLSETTVGLPTTLDREATTTIVIKDGQTVVIGGLIDETKNRSNYKVPVLGSIPILGYLFRSKTESVEKTNLYIFITPHIIETPAEAQEIYENKIGQMNEIREGAVLLNRGRVSQTKDERLCELGYGYLQVKEYDKAAEYYEKALKINPDNPVANLNMGIIHENKREFDKAIEMYEKVIATDSEERIYDIVDIGQTGKKATDIAKENLENLTETSE